MNISKNTLGKTPEFMSKTTRLLAGMVLLCSTSLVMAGPVEDTEKGTEAYNQGDVVQAMMLYRQAAETGYAPAQAKLAYILDQSGEDEEALEWYNKAIEQGNPEAKYMLGEKYAGGDDGFELDIVKAKQLIQEAAEGGHINAITTMAGLYEKGDLELPVDRDKMLYWLHKGADLKDRWSLQKLMNGYRKGESGLPVDEEQAKLWESRLNATDPK